MNFEPVEEADEEEEEEEGQCHGCIFSAHTNMYVFGD